MNFLSFNYPSCTVLLDCSSKVINEIFGKYVLLYAQKDNFPRRFPPQFIKNTHSDTQTNRSDSASENPGEHSSFSDGAARFNYNINVLDSIFNIAQSKHLHFRLIESRANFIKRRQSSMRRTQIDCFSSCVGCQGIADWWP